jgi:EpsI family protein
MKDKKFVIVLVILVVTAFFSILSYLPVKFDNASLVRISAFPATIGEWHSQDVPLTRRVYELLETDNLIMRDYTNDKGEVVNLYVIYSQSNRKVSHPPEICLQGEGATVVEKAYVKISSGITATKLVLEKQDYQEAVFYWYKVGPVFTHELLKQQLTSAIDMMFGKRTSIALIRVITQIKDKDQKSAFSQIASFSRQIEPLLLKYAP